MIDSFKFEVVLNNSDQPDSMDKCVRPWVFVRRLAFSRTKIKEGGHGGAPPDFGRLFDPISTMGVHIMPNILLRAPPPWFLEPSYGPGKKGCIYSKLHGLANYIPSRVHLVRAVPFYSICFFWSLISTYLKGIYVWTFIFTWTKNPEPDKCTYVRRYLLMELFLKYLLKFYFIFIESSSNIPN